LEQLHAAVLDGDPDRRRASIQTILNELLQSRRWPMNDLCPSAQAFSQKFNKIPLLNRRTSPAAILLIRCSFSRRMGFGSDVESVGASSPMV
jgi:hypothetical protein